MLTLGRLMGVKTCILTMVTVLENLKEKLTGQERTDAEDLLCRTALEGIYHYHMKMEGEKMSKEKFFNWFRNSDWNGTLSATSDNSGI